jgi:hypothetical protein
LSSSTWRRSPNAFARDGHQLLHLQRFADNARRIEQILREMPSSSSAT